MSHKFLVSANDLGENWNRFATAGDPFVRPAFLGTAEKVGAGGTALGWQACHLVLHDDAGTPNNPAALLPLYLRDHSFGDFSRDWGWAAAWQQCGLSYYPKLVSGIPYTPAPGPRLLVRTDLDRAVWAPRLLSAVLDAASELGASSWQCLFVEEPDISLLREAGLLMRRGVQFHWLNHDYGDFSDFLATFSADKRKKLKRERRAVAESGLRIVTYHGAEIDDALWHVIHRHYRTTFMRYGNHPAFPLEFFIETGRRLGQQLVVFVAFEDDAADGTHAAHAAVASAICYRDANTLHGRHWGCDITLPGLHFELCFYQGIDYCIRHGLTRFEPGAQGEHKLARGFEPTDTWSAFWIADPRMRRSVADFVHREDAAMQDYATEAALHLPFKAGAGN